MFHNAHSEDEVELFVAEGQMLSGALANLDLSFMTLCQLAGHRHRLRPGFDPNRRVSRALKSNQRLSLCSPDI
jgi:hypothetical protein